MKAVMKSTSSTSKIPNSNLRPKHLVSDEALAGLSVSLLVLALGLAVIGFALSMAGVLR